MSFIGVIRRGSRLVAVFVSFSCASPALAETLPAMVDPLFHLTLPQNVYEEGFAAVPQDVLQQCGVRVKPDAAYRYWLLASADEPAGRYIMIAGIVKEPNGGWSDDAKGSFLLVTGKTCAPIDPADEVFASYRAYASDGSPRIEKPVFVDLAADAVRRYGHAFGSTAGFVAALKEQHRYPEDPDMVLLRSAIEGAM